MLVAASPADERLVAARLRALAASGHRVDAIAEYGAFRERLADQLGVSPSAELVRAQHRAAARRRRRTAPVDDPHRRARRIERAARPRRRRGRDRTAPAASPPGDGARRRRTRQDPARAGGGQPRGDAPSSCSSNSRASAPTTTSCSRSPRPSASARPPRTGRIAEGATRRARPHPRAARGAPALLVARQLRARHRRRRAVGRRPARRDPDPARRRDEPQPADDRRRAGLPARAARGRMPGTGPAVELFLERATRRAPGRRAPARRRGAPVHAPRRPAARDRARGRPSAFDDGRADRGAPREPLRPAHRRRRASPERHRTLQAVIEWSWDPARPPRSSARCAGSRWFPDGFGARRGRVSAPVRRRDCGSSTGSSPSRCSPSPTTGTPRRGTGCWRPCASSASSRSADVRRRGRRARRDGRAGRVRFALRALDAIRGLGRSPCSASSTRAGQPRRCVLRRAIATARRGRLSPCSRRSAYDGRCAAPTPRSSPSAPAVLDGTTRQPPGARACRRRDARPRHCSPRTHLATGTPTGAARRRARLKRLAQRGASAAPWLERRRAAFLLAIPDQRRALARLAAMASSDRPGHRGASGRSHRRQFAENEGDPEAAGVAARCARPSSPTRPATSGSRRCRPDRSRSSRASPPGRSRRSVARSSAAGSRGARRRAGPEPARLDDRGGSLVRRRPARRGPPAVRGDGRRTTGSHRPTAWQCPSIGRARPLRDRPPRGPRRRAARATRARSIAHSTTVASARIPVVPHRARRARRRAASLEAMAARRGRAAGRPPPLPRHRAAPRAPGYTDKPVLGTVAGRLVGLDDPPARAPRSAASRLLALGERLSGRQDLRACNLAGSSPTPRPASTPGASPPRGPPRHRAHDRRMRGTGARTASRRPFRGAGRRMTVRRPVPGPSGPVRPSGLPHVRLARSAARRPRRPRRQPSSASRRRRRTCRSFMRSRTAVTMCETGLMFTNHCSHSGMVSAGTNAFERNVSGNRISIEMPCTLEALRAITPKNAKIQLTAPRRRRSRAADAAITPPSPPPGR